MVEKNKSEIKEWIKTWLPLAIYVTTCVWFAATLHSNVAKNEATIGLHDKAIRNMDTMIIQQQVRIEYNEKEIDRIRNSP